MIEASSLAFSFGEKAVLADVSLRVRTGEFMSIVGPHGAGKTTLLRLITGFLQPAAGEISLAGKVLDSYPRRNLARLLALVPQSEVVVFPYSVRTTVLLGRHPYMSGMGYESERDHEIADHMMELTETSHLADRPVTELSGGELHRVAIARALAQQTPVLLLDEPNAHLDLKHQIYLFELLRRLNNENGLTILCVTHDLNLAGLYSDSVAILNRGRLAASGSPSEVLTEDLIEEHFGVATQVQLQESGRPRISIIPAEAM